MVSTERIPSPSPAVPLEGTLDIFTNVQSQRGSQPMQQAVNTAAIISQLAKERDAIYSDTKLSTKEKARLLEANRRMLITAQGGSIRQTENVVYGILIFSAIVLLVLALLTAFAGLSSNITLAFVGTALGGTIATIAQKLGQV
jgi:hypothetical protein